MKIVVAVSAGQEYSRKGSSIVRQKLKYLNFGLLGLVTLIDRYSQYKVKMFQADDLSVSDLLLEIEHSGIDLKKDCECLLLSIPSFHSISWCSKFCEIVKKHFGIKIIVGGRWVVDNHSEWVKKKLRYVDIVSEGFGEKFMADYFGVHHNGIVFDGRSNCFSNVDYTLLHNYLDYNPNIEISRGCGSGCNFCADRNNPRLPNKPVKTILQELDVLDTLFQDYTPYYTAPHFVFSSRWVHDYCEEVAKRSLTKLWRCTTRVESVPLDLLADLRHAGLKIIDIGLESASTLQLTRMQKCANPERYLEKAAQVVEICSKNDIWVKLNIMLYAGETMDTVGETMDWLHRYKDYIKGVSAGSLVYYYNMNNLSELTSLGATVPDNQNLEENGFVDLNLSNEIDVNKAKELCIQIPQIVADQRDFFDIKAFSYYPPWYTFDKFMDDVKKCDATELPFRVEEK